MIYDFNIPRSAIEKLIDEWIFSERDRKILKRRILDGCTYEMLAEEFNLSSRQMQRIIHKLEDRFFKHLPVNN